MPQTTRTTDTRQRILDAALDLFATQGYDAVSVERVASRVNIKAPSLYKHFRSKQDIFDTIVADMDRRHEEQAARLDLSLSAAQNDAASLAAMDEDELVQKVLSMVRFVVHDHHYQAFRKMMTIEQYKRPELAQRYSERYLELYLGYHARLFAQLMEVGALPRGDAEAMAWQYFSPIVLAIGVMDRHPAREEEMEDLIRRHVHQFLRTHTPAKPTPAKPSPANPTPQGAHHE